MLITLAAVPVLVSALLGVSASWLADRLPPGAAVRLLAPAAFLTALATGFSLSVVAFTALARIPVVSALGQWSTSTLGGGGTPPPVAGAMLGLLFVALLMMALRRSARTAAEWMQAVLTCRELREVSDRLVLLDDPTADAFALPGLRGKIVITTGMLEALTARERRALLAHEDAHLAFHHQVYVQAAHVAAAANPLLRPVATQIRKLTERWADEHAASAVGDRQLTARAVAKAALARSATRRPGTSSLAMAAGAGDVTQRALALTRPAPTPRPGAAGSIVALALASTLAAVCIAHTTETKFEDAHTAYESATSAVQLQLPRTYGGQLGPQ